MPMSLGSTSTQPYPNRKQNLFPYRTPLARRQRARTFGPLDDMMPVSTPTKILSATLFTLVPLAYSGIWLWRPANAYGPASPQGVPPALAVLMVLVLLVSVLSWNRQRLVAALGILACFLWIVVALLPVL